MMNIEINNDFYIFVGVFASNIICYSVYLYCYKMQHRIYQYNMQNNIIPHDEPYRIVHMKPILSHVQKQSNDITMLPPLYTKTSDDITMLPPLYTV